MKKYLFLSIILTSIILFASCAASLSQTNFKEASDTVVPAKLTGPFSGTIKDAKTGEVLPFTEVYFYFIFEVTPNRYKTEVVSVLSDIGGNYYLKQFNKFKFWKPEYKLKTVKCAVLRKGYMPYLSNPSNFVQYNNTIKLKRKAPNSQSYVMLMPYMGMTNVYNKFTTDFYAASEELSSASELQLNSSGLILREQSMKILNVKTIPLLKEKLTDYNESSYGLYFDDGTQITWYVKSALSSQIRTLFNKIKLKLNTKPIKNTISGITMYFSKVENTYISVITDYQNGILIMLGCKGNLCSKSTIYKLSELAFQRKNTIIFTGGK